MRKYFLPCRGRTARRRDHNSNLIARARRTTPSAVESLEPRQLFSGTPTYLYNPSSGDVTFNLNNFTGEVQALTVYSASGQFETGNSSAYIPTQIAAGNSLDINSTTEQFAVNFNGFTTATLDLGDILPANLTQAGVSSDLSAYYAYSGGPTGTTGDGVSAQVVAMTTTAPPTVVSVTPEDQAGNGVAAGSVTSGVNTQGQRSLETQIAVVFSEPVNLAAGAFSLALINNYGSGANDGSPNTDVSAVLGTPTNPSGDGMTWIIPIVQNGSSTTYSYNLANGTTASLQDGIYQLGVNAASVTTAAGGVAMSSNYTSPTFHRLFGDLQNTDNLNNFDLSVLARGFRNVANLNTDLDFNGNGQADNTDLGAFRRNFNKTFTAPLGT